MRRKIEFMENGATPAPQPLRNEQIALAAHRLDQPGVIRVIADLRADTRNAHIDGAVLAVVFDAAQLGEDFFTGEDAPGVGREQPEQIELGAGQLDLVFAQPSLAQGAVDHQRAELQALGAGRHLRLSAPQQGADARQQQPRPHRLADVIVGAGFQPQHLIEIIGPRGEHEDRPIVAVAHPSADRQAVFAGQHQIEHHQVRTLLDDALDRTGAVRLDRHLEAAIAVQILLRQLGQSPIVLDDENTPRLLFHPAPVYASGHKPNSAHCTQRLPAHDAQNVQGKHNI